MPNRSNRTGFSTDVLAAIAAATIQLQLVILNGETQSPDDLFLQRLDLGICKLGDFAALGADDVIVVALTGGVFEQGAPIAELPLMGETGVFQELERPINGDEPDPRVPTPYPAVETLGADVRRGAEEGPCDHLALARRLQPCSIQVLLKLKKFILHGKEIENDYQYRQTGTDYSLAKAVSRKKFT